MEFGPVFREEFLREVLDLQEKIMQVPRNFLTTFFYRKSIYYFINVIFSSLAKKTAKVWKKFATLQ